MKTTVKLWAKIRRALKIRFEAAGITSCEIKLPQCWGDYCLAFSHTMRRGDMTSELDLERAVLACAPCATAAHGMGKHKEKTFLEKIIDARQVQP